MFMLHRCEGSSDDCEILGSAKSTRGGIDQIDSGTERLVVWARASSPSERGAGPLIPLLDPALEIPKIRFESSNRLLTIIGSKSLILK